jgi:hypothetical protein
MITIDEAAALAAQELGQYGISAPMSVRELDGGWRFWTAPSPGMLGSVHVLVVAATARVRTVSGGTSDAAAERELAR